ncbi:hypothetical protein HN670_02480 [bacterium]|jgi:hypothetical protein|nr:hypothetical protein [bacterium]
MPEKSNAIKFEQPSGALLMASRYLWAILLFVVIVTLSLGYFLVLQNRLSNIGSAREGAQDVNVDFQDTAALIQEVSRLSQEYEAVATQRSNDLRRLHKILPNEPQIAELFVVAEDLALRRGLYLANIDIVDTSKAVVEDDLELEAVTQGSKLKSLSINMSVNQLETEDIEPNPDLDSYDLFKLYLDDLEKNIRLFDIESVSFLGLGSEDVPLGIVLDITTYFVST